MSRLSVINLAELPPMQVIETIDTDSTIAARMARFKELWTENDPPAGIAYDVEGLEFDPIKVNQECSTYFELLLRDRVNQAARAVTLAFGSFGDLDAIASRYPGGVPRLPAVADPAPYATNPQDWETDDRYRRRIWLSPNVLSPHGTAESYVFWALTSDPTLHDASAVTTEGTGKVYVTIMPESGTVATMTWMRTKDVTTGQLLQTEARPVINPTPTLEQIVAVRQYILDEARRGLTDEIIVYGPKVTSVNYKVRFWLFPNVNADMAMTAIETAVAALIEKQRWLGYDHSRMAFDAALAQAGVHHAIIDEPFKDVAVDDRGLVKVDLVRIILAGCTE
jgi:phage-related baseplate assembly protein